MNAKIDYRELFTDKLLMILCNWIYTKKDIGTVSGIFLRHCSFYVKHPIGSAASERTAVLFTCRGVSTYIYISKG